MKSKIVSREELKKIAEDLKSNGKRLISTSGCFDILHAGHVEYLEEAKQKGDYLIVMLNTDASVRRLKGETRPIVSEKDRAIVLAALETVDYVCLFDETTPCQLIEEIQPDVVIKGGDYKGQYIPEMDIVAVYGGKVDYVVLVEGHSTTNIVKKIEKQYKECV